MIQIVSALPPMATGVGDYGLTLGCRMREDFGMESLFVVANEHWQPSAVCLNGFRAKCLRERSAQRLAETLCAATEEKGGATVLLQLSGYGYSHRGCPFWLLDGLKRWKRKQPSGRLVTIFHELYAPARVWSHTYWVSLAQKMAIGGIARLSDVALTNIDLHRAWLERCDKSKAGKIPVLAVASNVGELVAPGELRTRKRNLVVFGLAASRKRAYESRMAELQRSCELLEIAEVHDVGPPLDRVPERIGGAPVHRHGHISAEELSALLSQSMAGYVDYFPGYMAKSGVFAAYCAHRMLAVTPQELCSEADGLRSGVHYYNAATAARLSAKAAEAMAEAAWRWYQGHSIRVHSSTFADVLGLSRIERPERARGRA